MSSAISPKETNFASPPADKTSNDTSTSSALSPFDLYLISPPLQSNRTPLRNRASLTPPPHSETINRAIRTAECQLDAAVENVQRYISEGCPDNHERSKSVTRSPDSEYSDDLWSPKVLPDFRSPMRSPPRSFMKTISERDDVDRSGWMRRCSFDDPEDQVQFDNAADTLEIGLSKLQIDNRDDKENPNNIQTDDESEESVTLDATKPIQRRVIDDEDSSVESETFSNSRDEIDVNSDVKESREAVEGGTTLDDAFSGLVLDDVPDNESVQSTLAAESKDIQTTNDESDDDDSIQEIQGCGCWAFDKETKDMHLPPESGKWPRVRLPFSTYQKLYQHQRIGIQWMASLHRNSIKGGILADDMGMGKTMQTLVYLGSLMRAETIHNALIVCPKSVVRNWEREANLVFNDIVPKCEVSAITSDVGKEKRMRLFTEAFCSCFKRPRLVVTTYGLISSHITEFRKIATNYPEWQWCYVILDEGHCIKNPNTNVSKHVRIVCQNKKTRRLLLTGTPIQNNLRELHSLFDWATSGQLLGSSKTFINKYAIPIEEGRQKNASAWEVKKAADMNKNLQEVLQPYFLQRLKSSEFQDELPTKRELVVFVSLTKKQRNLYQKYLDGGMVKSVLTGETSSPLTAIAHLKQLCGHPFLVRDDRNTLVDDQDPDSLLCESAKLQVLVSLMQRLKRAGHRALIFSQSTKMLDVMERVFDGCFTYLRIDGQSAEKCRQRLVDDFNDKDSGIDCMLLSTKAAGVGLTLNGANRAIIYDPSWNPAEDAQAVDRCYRIGQSKNVTVYRMITSGTVEEKMYEKQVHKDGIKRVLLTESVSGSTKRYFDQAELRDLFKLAPDGAPCAMLTKFDSESAMDSSGKPSFLSKDPNVIGVASHDVLYNNASSNDGNTAALISSKASATPFTRSPFKNFVSNNAHNVDDNVVCVQIDTPPKFESLGGGLNRTRKNRENAKARKQNQSGELKKITETNELSAIDNALVEARTFVTQNQYDQAMDVLLGLLENKSDKIQGDTKLEVHEKISLIANKLGWLQEK